MDTIAQHLRELSAHVSVPRSVPGLVSRRLMVMSFMEGLPLMQLKDKVAHLPQWKREKVGRFLEVVTWQCPCSQFAPRCCMLPIISRRRCRAPLGAGAAPNTVLWTRAMRSEAHSAKQYPLCTARCRLLVASWLVCLRRTV